MAKPRRHNQPWTKEEIALLRAHYRKGTLHRIIAAELKRTLVAIESKAVELGISGKRKKK